MTDISVIILVGREELHIRRCLEKLAPLEPRQVFVVESQKGDRTHEIAIEVARQLQWQVKVRGEGEQWNGSGSPVDAGPCPRPQQDQPSTVHLLSRPTLSLVWHDWPGNQAAQFNWALDNLPIEGEWILRLDADEYLTDDSIVWLKSWQNRPDLRCQIPASAVALEFTLERKFCGGLIRHATNGIKMVRMFRRGCARYAETAMDERLIVASPSGCNSPNCTVPDDAFRRNASTVCSSPVIFYDDSLMPMSEWRAKHRGYAKREAKQALESLRTGRWTDPRKASYYRLPPYFRAFAYFCVRYFLKGGILDGRAGWMWNFWQGLWYRCLVDREISALRNGAV